MTAPRLRIAAWTLIGLATGALLAGLLSVPVVVSQIRSTQVDNTQKQDKQVDTLRLIRSCTTPGKRCYERGQRQTAKAVALLLTGNVNALACAMQVPGGTSVDRTIVLITTCLRDLPAS